MNRKHPMTALELWMWQAPCFNFELNSDEILELALLAKFVTKVGEELYMFNPKYDGASVNFNNHTNTLLEWKNTQNGKAN